ncbi:MAG: SpoIID/LytB domain-containing protein, partial [Lachnospiraceae bacterium]|nr:SpoIID/LytB domain-containing protein [Lachnospiraceae bacterium]
LGEFLKIYEQLLGMQKEKQAEGEWGELPEYRDFYVLLLEEGKLYDAGGKTYRYGNCEDYSAVFAKGEKWYPENDPVAEKISGRGESRAVSEYKNRVVRALCLGDELLYIREQLVQAVRVPNVWVISAQKSKVSTFLHGFAVEYETILPLEQGFENTVCDLVLENGKIMEITVKKDVIQAKVLLTSEKEIELEGYGRLPLSENFRIYKIYGDLAMEKTNRILVGYSVTDFVVEGGEICAALIKEKLKADTIRVLINTSGYKSYYHESVTLTADREFTVSRAGKKKKYKAGEEISFLFEKEKDSTDRILVETVGGEGKIILRSVSRTCGAPAYRGSMEIVAAKDGLIVVNELSMEEYLYAVIPSEMPTSYGDEALKVQAVCARSYAFNQLMASRFRSYGAHVDDSVSCQVYNNVAEDEASILAVKETYGLVAAYGGSVITAYYFSTSCGHTASYHEVWEGAPLSYLTGRLQNEEGGEVDFSKEESFREFILSDDIKTYDSAFSWYRWNCTLPYEQLLGQLKKATGLDTVTSVRVSKRAKSGIALEVSVTGTKGGGEEETVPICFQTAIRTAFAPRESAIVRKDGSEVKNMSLLPSAFVVIDEIREDGKLSALTLSGGGYGHGTGMSQNGVKKMAEAGKNYEEIIAYYYTGTELIFLY